jgi:hypothetical protein
VKTPIPPTDPPTDAEAVTDIGIARRAREAETAKLKLETELEMLRGQLAELNRKHDGRGDLEADPKARTHDDRCCARAPGGGKHPIVLVDAKERDVECKVCGATLDPIDVLLEFARAERMFSYHLASLRDETKALRKERDDLIRLRSSLKSQVRRKTARRDAAAKEVPAADREAVAAMAREFAQTFGTEKSGK